MAKVKPPVLGSLDYEEIKTSLINYLKSQNIIKDYNYEGSAIRTLIDLLSYNTFYYAYYMNMVASEMFLDSAQRIESLISLTKPLGYTVSGRRSARAKILVTGIDIGAAESATFPEHETFYGINEDGLQYTFVNLETSVIQDSDTLLEVIEGELVVDSSAINSFDFDKQKYYINNEDVDISSIRARVKLSNQEDYTTWRLVGNIGSNFQTEDNIYFIERLSSGGYAVQFGFTNSLGKSLEEDDLLEIRYVISSGSAANGIYAFTAGEPVGYTPGNLDVGTSCDECDPSNGGLDQPDIDLIKFVAPKWFSSQGRAVTKRDYQALVLNSNLVNGENDFVIFGGEEIYPPRYGRVFISLTGLEEANISKLLTILKENSVITILPEYVQPKIVDYRVEIAFKLKNQFLTPSQKQEIENDIKDYIQRNFIEYNKFNLELYADEVSQSVNSAYSNDVIMSSEDFSISMRVVGEPNLELIINSFNEFDVGLNENIKITSDITDSIGRNFALYLVTTYQTDLTKMIQLRAFYTQGDLNGVEIRGSFGEVDIKRGILRIAPVATNTYTVILPLAKKYINAGINVNNIYLTKVMSKA